MTGSLLDAAPTRGIAYASTLQIHTTYRPVSSIFSR
jgi:hypothetical protein